MYVFTFVCKVVDVPCVVSYMYLFHVVYIDKIKVFIKNLYMFFLCFFLTSLFILNREHLVPTSFQLTASISNSHFSDTVLDITVDCNN